MTGTVGPGFTITMNKKTVKAGTYAITIRDLASIHDFHLTGPGVRPIPGAVRRRHRGVPQPLADRRPGGVNTSKKGSTCPTN